MKKSVAKLMISRLVITTILIIIQALFLIGLLQHLSNYLIYIQFFFSIFSLIMIFYILNRNSNPTFKLPWMLLIIFLPLVGGVLYWLFGKNHVTKAVKKYHKSLEKYVIEKEEVRNSLKEQNITAEKQSYYLKKYANVPLSNNTETKYYPFGEDFFKDFIQDLKSAQNFIFLEYFIISFGSMWDEILEILKQKVKSGVEVRLLYDDLGCVALLPKKYYKEMEKFGIKCVPFNRFIPILSSFHNNRDHRKITIIDGKIGYTGGINLADEYINKIERFGRWKDTAVRLEGEGVWNLTLLFLEAWNKFRQTDSNFFNYKIDHSKKANGYVQAFGDAPLDEELISENVYLNLINQANYYVYINTPYLIIDYTMFKALCLAAKRGVDIRITTPHIPDKWYVHIISQSYYKDLIEAGIKIYEYTEGFIHAKSFLVDDLYGVVGTINLDYRSLVHHYECGVWMYQTDCLTKMKQDYLETVQKSTVIDCEFCKNIPWYKRWIKDILQLIAPLL